MKIFFKKFRKVVQKVIHIQIKIILVAVYFIFITPFGIVIRLFKDYLKIKSAPLWQDRSDITDIRDFLKKQ